MGRFAYIALFRPGLGGGGGGGFFLFFFSLSLECGNKFKDDLTGVESIFIVPRRPMRPAFKRLKTNNVLLDYWNLDFFLEIV